MWLITEDGGLVNLDRTFALEVRVAESKARLLAVAERGMEVVVARGTASKLADLVRTIVRELDADVVAVLDVRTGKGAVA
ncbi:MAG TPA: hypothetical protein VNO79_06495 [Actinomycetota bacterium]|nr:hypothetical protein [Actinomycetota bacterium]